MVKRVLKIVVAMSVITILLTSSALAVTGTVTGSTVRIREKASSNSQEISVATKGEKVEIIGEEGNWYQVKFEKVTGYISKDYVDAEEAVTTTTTTPEPVSEPEEPAPTTEPETTESENLEPEPAEEAPVESEPVETTTPVQTQEYEENQTITLEQDITLRYLPSFTSRVKVSVASGSTYTVKASLNNWVKLSNESGSGWVLKNAVEGTTVEENNSSEAPAEENSTEPETPVTNQPEASTGKVNVDSARIRKSPNGDVLDSLSRGTEVTILSEEGDWYQIKTTNYDSCYIAKRLITEN